MLQTTLSWQHQFNEHWERLLEALHMRQDKTIDSPVIVSARQCPAVLLVSTGHSDTRGTMSLRKVDYQKHIFEC